MEFIYSFFLFIFCNHHAFRKTTLLFYSISFLTFCHHVSGYEILTQECLTKYLKDRQITEEILSYVDGYVGSISDCKSAVRTKLANLYDNLRKKLNSDRTSRPFVECIMKDIEEEDDLISYENIILQETAVEMISNWRFWKYFSKTSRLETLQAEAQDIVKKSLLKCKGHREYGDLFSNINEKTTQWNRSGEQEYCIRKILVEKDMLNPNFYRFRDNPRNVRTESLDCQQIFKNVLDEFYKELETSNKISECFLQTYRKNGYAENILKAEVLSKLDLTVSDKSKEKQNFINSMVDITFDTRNC